MHTNHPLPINPEKRESLLLWGSWSQPLREKNWARWRQSNGSERQRRWWRRSKRSEREWETERDGDDDGAREWEWERETKTESESESERETESEREWEWETVFFELSVFWVFRIFWVRAMMETWTQMKPSSMNSVYKPRNRVHWTQFLAYVDTHWPP